MIVNSGILSQDLTNWLCSLSEEEAIFAASEIETIAINLEHLTWKLNGFLAANEGVLYTLDHSLHNKLRNLRRLLVTGPKNYVEAFDYYSEEE